MTETAKLADVILPGISYAEKEGTFTNTERRIQRIRKAVTIEGEATPEHPGTPIMHVGQFARGLGYFRPAQYTPAEEIADGGYPLTMMTGRILYHYNACAMTDKTAGINEIAGESFIELNTEDAELLGIEDGEKVTVSSRRGMIQTRACG